MEKSENYRPFIKKKVEAEAMTDNEIIKALERAMYYEMNEDVFKELPRGNLKEILDLINRKDAEIERLESKVKKLGKEIYDLCSRIVNLKDNVKYSKSEAIKEFAERLKAKGDRYAWVVGISKDEINHLVKEMTEQ